MNNLELILLEIVNREVSMEDKLSMLTEIGLTTTNDETFTATETIRAYLVEAEEILKLKLVLNVELMKFLSTNTGIEYWRNKRIGQNALSAKILVDNILPEKSA